MPSLAKIQHDDTSALHRWLYTYGEHGVYVSAKMDGSSVVLQYKDGKPVFLATRGSKGIVGKDISYMIPYLNLPKANSGASAILRCEIVLAHDVWKRKWSKQFDNDRNQVAGVLNRNDVHASIKDFTVFVLEDLSASDSVGRTLPVAFGLRCAEQKIINLKQHLPPAIELPQEKIDAEKLESLLLKFRKGQFKMDGLVLAPLMGAYKRSADKPKHMVAWKLNADDEMVTTTVTGLSWKVSRSGRITPKALLKPVVVDGVTVKHATLNNAKWAKDRGIGPGAVVKLRRSGGVIPEIRQVLKAGKFTIPPVSVTGDANVEWDENGTQLRITAKDRADHDGVVLDRMVRFLTGMEIAFAGKGTAQKLIAVGIDTPVKLMQSDLGDLQKLPGFGERSAERLYESVYNAQIGKHFIGKVAAASGVFDSGIGERRFQQIIEHDPTALGPRVKLQSLYDTPRLPEKVADNIAANWQTFKQFVKDSGLELIIDVVASKNIEGPLSGQCVTWTGYRNKAEEETVVGLGGTVVSFGSKTSVLIVSPTGKESTKVAKAKAKGIRVTTFVKLIK